MRGMERFIKTAGRKLGLEIKKYNIYSSEALQTQTLFSYNKVETVIDIGANLGQYAINLRENGFKGRIISFEPLSDAYATLLKNSLKDDEWVVAERMALGNIDGEIDINVSENRVSSSILPILESHTTAAPDSAYVRKETVPIRRLDSIWETLDIRGNVFVKIDVQGFELDVLKGAVEALKKTKGVELELSFVDLYKGQTLIWDMVKKMRELNFELCALLPCFIDEKSGRSLQVDGIFFR